MFHGLNRWPGSFYEFHKIIGPLTRPEKHGGKSDYAFHVVVPSLPGTHPLPMRLQWNACVRAC